MASGATKWESLTKRMAGIAERECCNKGFAVMTIQVLVDSNGEPAFYTEPQLTKIEPRIGASLFLDKILRIVSQGSLAKE